MPEKLADGEIGERLGRLQGWEVSGGTLTRTFAFPDFASALAFAGRVGELAERANHHPDLHVSWGKLRVDLSTHSAGGLTSADFDLAGQIDRL